MTLVDVDRSERFRRLYDDNVTAVHRFLTRRVGHEADDLTAEVMTLLWTHLERVGDGVDATRWLLVTARNVWFNHHRKTVRRRNATLFLDTSPGEPVEHDQVKAALRRMKPGQAELLILRYWDDLDLETISRILALSTHATSRRLWKARQVFAARYGEICTGDDMNHENKEERHGSLGAQPS